MTHDPLTEWPIPISGPGAESPKMKLFVHFHIKEEQKLKI